MCEKHRGNNITFKGGILIVGDRQYKVKEFPYDLPAELLNSGGLGGQNRENGELNYKGVPEEFLPYALYHESICGFIDGTGNCVDSVKKEIELVPENIKDRYLNWRISFFEGMINYAKSNLKGEYISYFQKLLEQMEKSYGYLLFIRSKNDLRLKIINNIFKPKKVFYPACGDDYLGINADITYLDPYKDSIDKLISITANDFSGSIRNIINSSLQDFKETPDFDFVILQNPHGIEEDIKQKIKLGTIVMAGNYIGTQEAEFFFSDNSFILLGVQSYEGDYIEIDDSNRSDYVDVIGIGDFNRKNRILTASNYFFKKVNQ